MDRSKVILRSIASQGIKGAVSECMQACGWQSLVPRDALVVVKPNLCTAVPEKVEMSNTDVRVTEAVCEILLTRTKRLYIGEADNLRQKAQEAFVVSRYVEMAKRLGVDLVNFSELPAARVYCEPAGEIELPRLLLDADVLITLPVLKTHALTYFTGALKNQWGCLPQYDRILLHKVLDSLIVSVNGVLQPKLAIMDGIVAAEGRGPVSGKPRRLDVILASRDPVALDATATRLVGLDPMRARHVVLAAERDLGAIAETEIVVDGDWDGHRTQFEPAILDRAVAAMNYMSRYRWFVRYILERDFVFYPTRALVQFLRRVGVIEGG